MTTTLYKIIDRFNNLFLEQGFKSVTYGTEQDVNLYKQQPEFPSVLIVYQGGNYNAVSTILNFIIIVGDKVDKTGNEYIKYAKDNTIDIQQDLIIKTQSVLNKMDQRFLSTYDTIQLGYNLQYDVSFDPFKEDYPDLLTGYIFTVNFSVPNMTVC